VRISRYLFPQLLDVAEPIHLIDHHIVAHHVSDCAALDEIVCLCFPNLEGVSKFRVLQLPLSERPSANLKPLS
jgi:hypothetical protein